MAVRQNVHGDILKLSQYLSAGNGDNFRNEAFRNQEKLKF
jgi:hypothetical protein